MEFDTCTSGLSDLRYPHAFPSPPRHSRSPPAISSPPVTNATVASATTGEGVYPLSSVLNASSSPTIINNLHSPMSNSANTPHTPATTIATNSSRKDYHTGSTTANPQEDEITWFYYLAEIALRKIERKLHEALHPDLVTVRRSGPTNLHSDDDDDEYSQNIEYNDGDASADRDRHRRKPRDNKYTARNKYSLRPPPPAPPRAPTPAEMEELINLTAEFEIQLDIWYSYLPSAVKFADLDTTPCRDERLQYLRGRAWKTKSDLYRPFLYHLIHQPHPNHIRDNYPPGTFSRVAEFARKGLMYDKFFIMATIIEHRHHGAWLTLRNSGSGCLVYLAATKCGYFIKEEEAVAGRGEGLAIIPDGWEEALGKAKTMLRSWGEQKGARDAVPLVDLICRVEDDWFGASGAGGSGSVGVKLKGEVVSPATVGVMGMGVMGGMGQLQGRW